MRKGRGCVIRVQPSKHSSEIDEPLFRSLGKMHSCFFILTQFFFSNAATFGVIYYLSTYCVIQNQIIVLAII